MAEAGRLPAAIAETAALLSAPALAVLVGHLRRDAPASRVREAVPTSAYQATVERLLSARAAHPSTTGPSLALALESAAASRRDQARVSIVWTGPTTGAVSVRRTDQALLQLINRATERLIVVSFAVYRVPVVASSLQRAADRGVAVDLVVETEEASGGKVAFDGWQELVAGVDHGPRLWTWDGARRPVTSSGTRASLHAKCAVGDGRRLLVSSANLTEFAHQLNMELGLLIQNGEAPARVERHLDALMESGELRRLS